MKTIACRLLAILALTLTFARTASGITTTIYDIGPGPDTLGGVGLSYDQWEAGKFTLASFVTFNTIDVWMNSSPSSGPITLSVYSDVQSGLPGPTQLYSAELLKPGTRVSTWHTAGGLTWDLGAGSYWFTITVSPINAGAGSAAFPGPGPAPSKSLFTEFASWHPAGYPPVAETGGWFPQNSSSLYFRISGDTYGGQGLVLPPPVPDTGVGVLLALTLAGLALARRCPS
jgi:hypothetical protein